MKIKIQRGDKAHGIYHVKAYAGVIDAVREHEGKTAVIVTLDAAIHVGGQAVDKIAFNILPSGRTDNPSITVSLECQR